MGSGRSTKAQGGAAAPLFIGKTIVDYVISIFNILINRIKGDEELDMDHCLNVSRGLPYGLLKKTRRVNFCWPHEVVNGLRAAHEGEDCVYGVNVVEGKERRGNILFPNGYCTAQLVRD
ncbi:unnamed protein product [Prunus armeniaca]